MVWQELHGTGDGPRLFARDPFGDQQPTYIRIVRYRYRFAPPDSPRTWDQAPAGAWLPPVSRDSAALDRFVRQRWPDTG